MVVFKVPLLDTHSVDLGETSRMKQESGRLDLWFSLSGHFVFRKGLFGLILDREKWICARDYV